jgi:hypothetical protein
MTALTPVTRSDLRTAVRERCQLDPNDPQQSDLILNTLIDEAITRVGFANPHGWPWDTVEVRSVLTAGVETLTGFIDPSVPTSYLSLTGNPSSYVTAPDRGLLSPTGYTLDVRARIAPANWTGVDQTIVAKWQVGGVRTWLFVLDATGKLNFYVSSDGNATGTPHASTVATGFNPGTTHWVRVTYNGDDGAGNKVITYYTSDDGVAWTQLGAPVVEAGTIALLDTTSIVEVGSDGNGGARRFTGNIYRIIMFDDLVGGNLIADPDFSSGVAYGNSVTDSVNSVWTLQAAATFVYTAVSATRIRHVILQDTANLWKAPLERVSRAEQLIRFRRDSYQGVPLTYSILGADPSPTSADSVMSIRFRPIPGSNYPVVILAQAPLVALADDEAPNPNANDHQIGDWSDLVIEYVAYLAFRSRLDLAEAIAAKKAFDDGIMGMRRTQRRVVGPGIGQRPVADAPYGVG